MRPEDIHIGDTLRIRQWDDMEAEFGLNNDGSIDCYDRFTDEMRYLCGRIFTVKGREFPDVTKEFTAEEEVFAPWFISFDMLEPCIEDELPEPVSETELLRALFT